MVKTILIIISVKHTATRRYFPEENDYSNKHFIIMPDANGDIHVEDLKRKTRAVTVSNNDVTFYMYTRSNPETPEEINAADFKLLQHSANFNKDRNNYFIVHGWKSDHLSDVNTMIKSALLANFDVNVFAVDWKNPANKFYTTAKKAVPLVGEIIGNFIGSIMENFEVAESKFILVGHSLGAHVCGAAGAAVEGKVKAIVGLDPASPLFTLGDTNNRLDTSDAEFVQVIHTSTIAGMKSSIGHSDYFPNGGSKQPGCGLDLFGSCAHSRAYHYFAESIKSSGFISFLCHAYNAFSNGECYDNHISFLGEFQLDHRLILFHYLLFYLIFLKQTWNTSS